MTPHMAAICLIASLGLATPAIAEMVALTGANVADLDGKPALQNAVVLIDGERIKAIGPVATTPVPAGTRTIPLDCGAACKIDPLSGVIGV